MIEILISESTGKVTHENKITGHKTEIKGLPPQASLKAILARVKALGLRVK